MGKNRQSFLRSCGGRDPARREASRLLSSAFILSLQIFFVNSVTLCKPRQAQVRLPQKDGQIV